MHKRIGCVLTFALACLTIQSHAQWIRTNGPYTGNVFSLALDGSRLYAGTSSGHIYTSTDSGATWTAIGSLNQRPVNAMAVLNGKVFAGTYDNAFVSTDEGVSWNPTKKYADVNTFFVSPNRSGGLSLFMGTQGGGVYRSTDEGATWDQVNNGLPDVYIKSFAQLGSILFTCTWEGNGIFRTTNSGDRWDCVNKGLSDLNVRDLAVSGSNIFASTRSNMYCSSDSGASWTLAGSRDTVYCPVFATIGPNVFAGTEWGSVYLTRDNGHTWTYAGLDRIFVHDFAVIGSRLIAATDGGIYSSSDSGASWSYVGVADNDVCALLRVGNKIVAGTTGGMYMTIDGGTNWNWVKGGSTTALASIRNSLFAGDETLIFRSADSGSVWYPMTRALGYAVTSFAATDTCYFAGTAGAGVYRSTDRGGSWSKPVGRSLGDSVIHALANLGMKLFVAGANGNVYFSTDAGRIWYPSSLGLSASPIQAISLIGSNLYVGTKSAGIFQSSDGGVHWNACNCGLANLDVYSFASKGDYLFAGSGSGRVLVSIDNGSHWAVANQRLPVFGYVRSLLVRGDSLYAGTVANGVWKRPISELVTDVDHNYRPGVLSPILHRNYPNPFNPSTTIQYDLSATSHVRLVVYDVLGQVIDWLVDERKNAGTYSVKWNAARVPSGIYFYRLQAGEFMETRKMILLK